MINGDSLIGANLQEANEILAQAEGTVMDTLQMVVFKQAFRKTDIYF